MTPAEAKRLERAEQRADSAIAQCKELAQQIKTLQKRLDRLEK